MTDITRVGLDTSKSLFQLHGVNAADQPVLRKQLRRSEMIKFFEKLPPAVIALEACGASHHWARLLSSYGHEVKLIAPQLAKPYVKRGKNDAADAEALCEAASRPTMRFVPVKSADQQAALMLVGVRTRLIKRRTQLANAARTRKCDRVSPPHSTFFQPLPRIRRSPATRPQRKLMPRSCAPRSTRLKESSSCARSSIPEAIRKLETEAARVRWRTLRSCRFQGV